MSLLTTSSNLVDLIRARAEQQPEKVVFRFLDNGEQESSSLTYLQADRRARKIAVQLRRAHPSATHVVILCPTGPEVVTAFLGCLYAGMVAVPAASITEPRQHVRATVRAVAQDSGASVAITRRVNADGVDAWVGDDPVLRRLSWVFVDNSSDLAEEWKTPALSACDPAYLQYTSGSVSAPKGVVITHGNLLRNVEALADAFAYDSSSVYVGWTSMAHSMGLIQGLLHPICCDFTSIMMPPSAFLMQPLRWLSAVSRYRASHSGAPNFAYELCAREIPESALDGLRLESWQVAYLAAEAIHHETLMRFANRFARCGFSWKSFCPGYGLSEATTRVSATRSDREPAVFQANPAALERGQVEQGEVGASKALVGVGGAILGVDIAIVHPESRQRCRPDQIGEIWVRGPTVSPGYWQRPKETADAFQGELADTTGTPYLRSGDLGFLRDGVLFVTGRIKDLLLIRGRKLIPQDVEITVGRSHPALEGTTCVAFTIDGESEDKLIIVAELKLTVPVPRPQILGAIRNAVAATHLLRVHDAVFVEEGTIPRTVASGKLRRQACRAAYLGHSLSLVRAL